MVSSNDEATEMGTILAKLLAVVVMDRIERTQPDLDAWMQSR